MTKEEVIQNNLAAKFSFLADKMKIQRERRIFTELPAQNLREVIDYAMKNLGFMFLCTISGLDEGEKLSFMYHLTRQDGVILTLKISVPKDAGSIKSVIDYFGSADIYERELVDLFGAKVEGLPEGRRYPLPDNWPAGQYPLRKDWKKNA